MAFGNKNSTPSFVLTLPMKVTEQDEIFLSKKFRVGCTVYNQMVTKTTKMWHQLRKTREYKNLVKAIKAAPANSDKRKALLVQRSNLIKQAGFSEGAFHKLVVPYQKAYNVNCDVAQKVASAVWKAWDDFFYRCQEEIQECCNCNARWPQVLLLFCLTFWYSFESFEAAA